MKKFAALLALLALCACHKAPPQDTVTNGVAEALVQEDYRSASNPDRKAEEQARRDAVKWDKRDLHLCVKAWGKQPGKVTLNGGGYFYNEAHTERIYCTALVKDIRYFYEVEADL